MNTSALCDYNPLSYRVEFGVFGHPFELSAEYTWGCILRLQQVFSLVEGDLFVDCKGVGVVHGVKLDLLVVGLSSGNQEWAVLD